MRGGLTRGVRQISGSTIRGLSPPAPAYASIGYTQQDDGGTGSMSYSVTVPNPSGTLFVLVMCSNSSPPSSVKINGVTTTLGASFNGFGAPSIAIYSIRSNAVGGPGTYSVLVTYTTTSVTGFSKTYSTPGTYNKTNSGGNFSGSPPFDSGTFSVLNSDLLFSISSISGSGVSTAYGSTAIPNVEQNGNGVFSSGVFDDWLIAATNPNFNIHVDGWSGLLLNAFASYRAVAG